MGIGPHVILPTTAALAWARRAPIVKALDTTAPLIAAPADAVRVFRHFYPTVDVNNPDGIAAAALDALHGYRHPRLYVELLFELFGGGVRVSAHVDFLRGCVARLKEAGVLVCGPAWGSGAYDDADFACLRAHGWLGLDAIGLQAYWADAGPSPWNGYRWRDYWQPGDPPVIVVECGRDRVRDGPNGQYVGGPWAAASLAAEQYAREIDGYGASLRDESELGACVFTAGPTPDWQAYGIDAVIPLIAARARNPAEPHASVPGRPEMLASLPGAGRSHSAPHIGSAQEKTMIADYRRAEWLGSENFGYPNAGDQGRQGHRPVALVAHTMEGSLAGCVSWFQNPVSRVSTHYAVGKDGRIVQFVREADAAWGNGTDPSRGYDSYRSDLTVPWIADLWQHGVNANLVTISCEFEGFSGEALTEAQYRAGLDLCRDVFARNGWRDEPGRLIGHCQIDAVTRPGCPGPAFPYARYAADLRTLPGLAVEVNRLDVSVYAQWAQLRLARGSGAAADSEVRGATGLAAFKQFLAATGRDPSDATRWGWPCE